jgi:ArsR family transcriptional regulator, arsenate/arsenite/antimonite-responsive transcriptional repressor
MEQEAAILALAALAQNTRLEVFRLLVRHEPEGLPAGEIARTIAVPGNTLSSHLNVLSHAGLVRGERHSRSIVYHAEIARLSELASFLIKDCCGGRADLCAPQFAEFSPCCPDKAPAND